MRASCFRSFAISISCAAACLAWLSAGPSWSQGARLADRLDPQTASVVSQIIETARASGLPTATLESTALEGAAKGAPPNRIISTVRRHAQSLAQSRDLLGEPATEPEIVAGAGALLAGIPPDSLPRLRAARPGRSLVIPLVVLADLVARRVPAVTATSVVLDASRAGVRDSDLLRLRERVEHDIGAGASPATAAAVRTRALVRRLEGRTHEGNEDARTASPPIPRSRTP